MKTRIDLLGTSFILHSDEDEAYIQHLCDMIKEKLQQIQQEVDCSDPLKLSIMSSLLLTHELLEERKKTTQLNNDTTSSATRLITMLDQAIDERTPV